MPWHHSPLHVFAPNITYMVTAGTLHKKHFFHGNDRLVVLQELLLEMASHYGWNLQAWAVFSSHYHWIGVSPDNAASLRKFVSHLHTQSAAAVNKLDHATGRKVWFQYWDTCLTFDRSYFARLNYVHNNPVHHKLVAAPEHYEFCSARWFLTNAERGFIKKVLTFKSDAVNVVDDF